MPKHTLCMLLLVLGSGPWACDVFVAEAGEEAEPCLGDGDCLDGYKCLYQMCMDAWMNCQEDQVCLDNVSFEAYCEHQRGLCVPWAPDGMGVECWGPEDCPGGERCEAFPADGGAWRCVRGCDMGKLEDPCGGTFGEVMCLMTASLDRQPVCARPVWSHGLGILCDPGSQISQCPDEFRCVDFPALQVGICTQTGCSDLNQCPPGMECHPDPASGTSVCGYPAWHGFWIQCETNDECAAFTGYPECNDFGSCSRPCTDSEECPQGAVCRHPDNFCVLDKPEYTR